MTIKENAPYKDFAARLYHLRKEAKLTRAELGEKCGVSSRAIVNYESGSRVPKSAVAGKMAEVFGISTDELLGVTSPELAMRQSEVIDEMGRIFGKKAEDSAQAYLDGTSALLAGGTLTEEEQLGFISVMQKILADASLRASKKFTANKFRTPEWEKRNAERAEAVRQMNARLTETDDADEDFEDD